MLKVGSSTDLNIPRMWFVNIPQEFRLLRIVMKKAGPLATVLSKGLPTETPVGRWVDEQF
jgi:hypothetical protein